MKTVIAAVLVNPKSSQMLSKFFFKVSSTLIDSVDCAIIHCAMFVLANIIQCVGLRKKVRLSTNMLAAENHLADERCLVAVRDEGEGRDGGRDDEVGEFADGN